MLSRSTRTARGLKRAVSSCMRPLAAPARGNYHLPDLNRGDGPVYKMSSNGVRELVLNRPKALHALNLEMVRELTKSLKAVQHTESNHAVVLRSEGIRAFCAGGDIVALHDAGVNGGDTETFFREEYYLDYLTSVPGKPLVTYMDGATMGGGVGISQHCTYRVATENTLFAMPETAIGFFPDVGGSHFLSRLDGQLGMYLALTGARLKGYDLVHAGLATHYIQSAWTPLLTNRLKDGRGGIEFFPQTVNSFANADFHGEPMEDSEFSLAPYMDVMQKCFSQDSVEAIMTALLESDEHPEWCKKTHKTMQRMSPTSLKVTFEQIRRGLHMNLADCLMMEFRMSQNFMRGHDFFAGVNSLLITKDKNPQWNPSTLEGVTDDMVQSYFEMPAGIKELVLPCHEIEDDDDRLWHANFLDEDENNTESFEAYVPETLGRDINRKVHEGKIKMDRDSGYIPL